MKIRHFFNDLYERLLDLKENNWLETKAATMPFIVIFTAALMILFFVFIALVSMFWTQ